MSVKSGSKITGETSKRRNSTHLERKINISRENSTSSEEPFLIENKFKVEQNIDEQSVIETTERPINPLIVEHIRDHTNQRHRCHSDPTDESPIPNLRSSTGQVRRDRQRPKSVHFAQGEFGSNYGVTSTKKRSQSERASSDLDFANLHHDILAANTAKSGLSFEEERMGSKRQRSYRRKSDEKDYHDRDFAGAAHAVLLRTNAKPSVYHAIVIIFLEFFAWGLLTIPTIECLSETFGEHTLLINGLVQGIKGLLSFLSAPLIGALSDVWGRKMFLLLTVISTCAPLPLMTISPWWFFAAVSLSGCFAVTYSIIFAYVADITQEDERSAAYGMVSATFAASLVTSPALGRYLSHLYGRELVVALATVIATLDVVFILIAVPESLPEKVRPTGWARPISWQNVDPFRSLREAMSDNTNCLLCICVFLSYLPEAGQYSCFFVYLSEVICLDDEAIAMLIAVMAMLSIIAQTVILTGLIQTMGNMSTIMIGLLFQIVQLIWYAFGHQEWMMWAAAAFAAVSSISYPAISSFLSTNADVAQQGVVQGMVTGVRGLCGGLGPAMFGIIFYLFGVEISEKGPHTPDNQMAVDLALGEDLDSTSIPQLPMGVVEETQCDKAEARILPGPPFLFGAVSVAVALIIASLLPRRMRNEATKWRATNLTTRGRTIDHEPGFCSAEKLEEGGDDRESLLGHSSL